jgi:hypothetical protein
MSLLDGGIPYRPDFSSEIVDYSWMDHCPCLQEHNNKNDEYSNDTGVLFGDTVVHRFLAEKATATKKVVPKLYAWHPYVVTITLIIMFGFMMTDYIIWGCFIYGM